MQPRQIRETLRPVLPRRVVSMTFLRLSLEEAFARGYASETVKFRDELRHQAAELEWCVCDSQGDTHRPGIRRRPMNDFGSGGLHVTHRVMACLVGVAAGQN